MSNRSRVRPSFVLLAVFASCVVGPACTLLLSKEPLACAVDGDCARYPGTTCQAGECRAGTIAESGAGDVGSGEGATDAPAYDGSDPCANPDKPLVELKGDISENLTLKCDKDYLLVGRVAVVPPFTFTITAGTTVYGSADIDPATNSQGTLVVPPGSRLVALGKPDAPIVFTSAKKKAQFANTGDGGVGAGDWGGIFILGEAPVNVETGKGNKAGLGPWGQFGGTKPNNDSGRLEYVRIEYAGAKLPEGQDGVSLDLAGVGDQTTIDHVQFRFPGDDCVEIIGGTVNIKHMLCQYPYDDGIAWENGWTGKAQFVVVQGRPLVDNNSNGLQGRSGVSGAGAAVPISSPTIYNGTFCGQNSLPNVVRDNQQYGVRADSYSRFKIANSIFMGWEALMDLRGSNIAADTADAGGTPAIEFRNSLSYGNVTANVAFPEVTATGTTKDPTFDDDEGFDESAWWRLPVNQNSEANPGIPKCFDPISPRFATSGPIGAVGGGPGTPTAATPPSDGFFDTNARYLGAFRDQTDSWATGKWVVWSDK